MKKKLIALAVAGLASSGVMAQSNVTIYGNIDLALMHASGTSKGTQGGTAVVTGTGVNAAGLELGSQTTMNNGTRSSSRLGFKGGEDLGGGLKAGFVVESGIVADGANGQAAPAAGTTGNGLFANREASLSLAGGLGDIKVGRQPTYVSDNFKLFDATGASLSSGSIGYLLLNPISHTSSNSIKYTTPSIGGVVGMYQLSMSENQDKVAATSAGTQSTALVNYTAGPLILQAAQLIARDYSATSGVLGKNFVLNQVAGSYDFGVAKLMGQYVTTRNTTNAGETTRTIDANTYNIGASIPLAAHTFRVNYVNTNDKRTNDADASSLFLGYDYALSKRSVMYVGTTHVRNKNGAQFSANADTTAAMTLVSKTSYAAATAATGAVAGRTNAVFAGLNHTF